MGRSKTKKMKSQENEIINGDKHEEEQGEISIDSILAKAEENLDTFDHDAAKANYHKALELDANCVKAIDKLANIHMDLGEVEDAIKYFKQSIQLSPESGYSKYLSLAQLYNGKEALDCYTKGIGILDQDIEKAKESNDEDSIKNLLRFKSSAFCSISELYMTDYCDEANAEDQCKSFIQKAIDSDDSNPEAYQLMSSYYLVVDDHNKALEMMEKSLSLWLPQYQAVREGRDELNDGIESCPLSYSCRINTVKNCLELAQFDEAEMILNGLAEEDDEVVDVWYLLGLMNELRGEDYHGNAKFFFTKSKEVAQAIGDFDEELLNEIEERLQKLSSVEEEEDMDDEEDKENDDEYEDIESSDEEMEQ